MQLAALSTWSSFTGSRFDAVYKDLLRREAANLLEVSQRKTRVPAREQDAPGVGKVAFLFVTEGDIDTVAVWDKFFDKADTRLFSIYITQPPGGDGEGGAAQLKRHFVVQGVDSPKNVGWCALMGQVSALLQAALQDIDNKQLVLVSRNSVPLKPFDYVYWELVGASANTSKFCLATSATWDNVPAELLLGGNPFCGFRTFGRPNRRFPKHHQWAVFSRDHAQIIVDRAPAALEEFGKVWAGNVCTDETLPLASLLLDLEERTGRTNDNAEAMSTLQVEPKCYTYVAWYNCLQGTEFDGFADESSWKWGKVLLQAASESIHSFGQNSSELSLTPSEAIKNVAPRKFEAIDASLLESLVLRSGFMFARKFSPSAVVVSGEHEARIEEVLPEMWPYVDAERARRRTFHILDASPQRSEARHRRTRSR